ncbi:tripartite tricarboxylate transporter substrate binding protein [Caproicibacter sp.]|uniref:tripartite tricarboxylate transporter substrate binding protein n=1 Tax=Caproicibacter sp. TaxID=2814884 RepID=UPI003989313F
MKNLKKILSATLTLAMTAALFTGCSGTGSASSSASSAAASKATDFPTKQISLIVPYSAGGASDTVARIYASQLQQVLGKPVIVTNKTGASGAVGLEYVKNSKADGYTIAYMPVESTMLKALGFTTLSTDDFKFVARAMTIPAAITVRSDSKWKTLQDFVDYAKAHPGEIKVGNSGTGSIWQIAAASIEQKTGCKFTHVPFDGAAPAVAALLGKNIDATAVSPSEVQSSVDSGELKILAVIGDERSSIYPDIKTAKEQGIDVSVQGWGGFAVPKDTPQEIVDVLEKASKTAINSDDVKKLLSQKGYNFAYMNGSDMDTEAKKELADYSALIPQLGIVKQ